MSGKTAFSSLAVLLAHARAIEAEALERYTELADQMETHNNPEVAALFRKMAHAEQLHVEKILERIGETELPHISPWAYQWLEAEAPESASGDVHYMMTPFHALNLALEAEKRARAFYARIVETATEEGILTLARELFEEECEHVRLVERWLAEVGEPEEDWSDDPDPPALAD